MIGERPVRTAEASAVTDRSDPVRASIVVCTRDNAAMLAETIESLLEDHSLIDRELIVVDNGSTDHTKQVVNQAQEVATIPVRYEFESTPGASHARNRGVARAEGEFILFTDDDVFVKDGWADALTEMLSDHSVLAVGGRILPHWPFDPPEWLRGPHASRLTLTDQGASPRVLDRDSLPCTVNLAVRRSVLESFDPPFDPRLGPSGRLKLDGEDWQVMQRILSLGTVSYQPNAVVSHRIRPERIDYGYLRKSFFQLGMGSTRSERIRGAELGPLRQRLKWTAKSYYGACRIRIRNARREVGSSEAAEEFENYIAAGGNTEKLLSKYPALGEWIAGRVR